MSTYIQKITYHGVSIIYIANYAGLLRNPGRDISFPIFIRKEIETRKLERKSQQKYVGDSAWVVRLFGEIIPSFSEGIIDRTGAQTMLYLTCTTITSINLAHYGVSRAKDWVSVKCGTTRFIDLLYRLNDIISR